jgi:uncharacterized protein YqgC (DUF456 family)
MMHFQWNTQSIFLVLIMVFSCFLRMTVLNISMIIIQILYMTADYANNMWKYWIAALEHLL